MKKIISSIMAVIMLLSLISLAGCGEKSADVYFLNFKPESANAYKKIAEAYENETGVKVKIVTAAAGGYEQTLKSEIAKNEPPTIFQINGPVGFSSWEKYCADITDSAFAGLLTDKNLAVTKNGKIYAVPYVIEAYGIIYNNAIMEKYFALPNKKVSINSAEEINNFATLKAVVEDMTSKKQELGIKGVFASTSLSTGEDWRWQTHLANMAAYYEFKDNENIVSAALDAKEIEFKYAENFKNIFDLYINNSVSEKTLLGSKTVEDSMAEFALSQCAMVQNGTWAWSQISGVKGNTVKSEDVKMLPIYTGINGEEEIGLCTGTENYFAINKNVSEEKQKESLNFLYWLFTSDTGKAYVKDFLGFTTPFKTMAEYTPEDPLAKEVSRYLNDQSKTNIPWVFTAFPSDAFKKEFGNALLEYAQGSATFDQVKKRVIDKWKSER